MMSARPQLWVRIWRGYGSCKDIQRLDGFAPGGCASAALQFPALGAVGTPW
jgi:hypothetical protein